MSCGPSAEPADPAESTAPAPRRPRYYTPRMLGTGNSLLYQLRRAQLAVGQLISEESDLGCASMPQWVPLHKVHQGQANTVVELARLCTVDVGAMTRLLDRLEHKGLCRRVRSEVDRRVVHIELTPEGVAAAERMPQVLCGVYNRVLANFTPEEWAQLQTLLGRLTAEAERLSVKKGAS